MNHLPTNIKIIRGLARQTQKEFIKKFTGVTEAMQKSYESGVAKPDVVYMETLSDFSGIPVDKLAKTKIDMKDVNIKVEKVEKGETVADDDFGHEDPDQHNPVMQVVINLSYIGKKNADTMERMAATNEYNIKLIAALVGEVLPNSKLAARLAASLADLHEDDDFSIEEELNEEGIEKLKHQMNVGKKTVKGK